MEGQVSISPAARLYPENSRCRSRLRPPLRERHHQYESVRKSTWSYLHEAAATEEEMEMCLERGAEVVRQCHEEGSNVLSFGEMGIGKHLFILPVDDLLYRHSSGTMCRRRQRTRQRGHPPQIRSAETVYGELQRRRLSPEHHPLLWWTEMVMAIGRHAASCRAEDDYPC